MTTVGLELTSFIDPSLNWKTVSKGRNTSRRSRRAASKSMKMIQVQEKRSPKRPNSMQLSESEKVCNCITFWWLFQVVLAVVLLIFIAFLMSITLDSAV